MKVKDILGLTNNPITLRYTTLKLGCKYNDFYSIYPLSTRSKNQSGRLMKNISVEEYEHQKEIGVFNSCDNYTDKDIDKFCEYDILQISIGNYHEFILDINLIER